MNGSPAEKNTLMKKKNILEQQKLKKKAHMFSQTNRGLEIVRVLRISEGSESRAATSLLHEPSLSDSCQHIPSRMLLASHMLRRSVPLPLPVQDSKN